MRLGMVPVFLGIAAVTAGVASAQGGFGMVVKPGMVVNAAHFGLKSDAAFFGAGLEFASAGLSAKTTWRDTSEGRVTEGSSESKMDVSVFLPQLAGKFYLGGSAGEDGGGSARPFIWASLFYSIATSKVAETYGTTTTRDTATERQINDALGGNFGGAAAIGGEYFFSPHFGLSGEFGARLVFGGLKSEYAGYYYTSKMTSNLGLGFT